MCHLFTLKYYLSIREATFSDQWLLAGQETFCCVHQQTADTCETLTKGESAELHYDHIANLPGVFLSQQNTFRIRVRMEYKMPKT